MTIKKSGRQSAALKAGVLATSIALSAVLVGCNKGNTSGGGGGGTTNTGAVATVNGEAITRDALHSHLEATYGETAARQLIDFALITQKLKAENLSVTDAEVDAAITARQASTPAIAEVVTGKGVRYEALQRQTRYQLAIDKLLTKDVKATEDQIKKWFETRRAYYDTPTKAKIGILLSTVKARADVMAAQLKDKSKGKSFQELVNAQKTANDPAAASSIAESPEMIAVDVLPALLKNSINALQTGQTSNVITLKEGDRTAYAILRLVKKQPAVKADYAKLKSQLEMDYKLEQVARKLNGENPGNPPFDQTLEQVKGAVAAQNGGQTPAFRELLTFITQTQSANLTNDLRKAAKVESTDPTYIKVVESYKPAPGATSTPAAGGAAPSAPAPSTAPTAPATP